jgi:hypothetical protein
LKNRKTNLGLCAAVAFTPVFAATVAMAGPPANDDCANASVIAVGDHPYDTTGATTDGVPHAGCMFDGQTYHDIWYLYTAGKGGTLTVSTCNQNGYDTDLVLYNAAGACPPGDGDLLGCNDDFVGCAGFSSEISVPVSAGDEVRIRVGGWNDGNFGPATLTVALEGDSGEGNDNCENAEVLTNDGTEFTNEGATDDGPSECGLLGSDIWYTYQADFDGMVTIDTCGSSYDTAIAAYFGCGCPVDPEDLQACNDDTCGLQSSITFPVANGQCYLIQVGGFAGAQGSGVINVTKDTGGDPCDGAEGDCCEANGSPGCDDPECCSLICDQDPFCCETEWDGICADAAASQCEGCFVEPCDLVCEDTEGEPCGDDNNGGCNSSPPAFGSVACGETICGNAWADGGTRDTDWYLISVPADDTTVSAILTSEFDGVCFIVDGIADCAPVVVGDTGSSSNCEPGATAQATVAAGDYVIFAASGAFEGTPCGTNNDYTVQVDADPCGGPKPSGALDIKPGSCPNSWNPGSNGVLPVALVGSEEFDVADVDVSTLAISRADGGGGSVAPNMGEHGPARTQPRHRGCRHGVRRRAVRLPRSRGRRHRRPGDALQLVRHRRRARDGRLQRRRLRRAGRQRHAAGRHAVRGERLRASRAAERWRRGGRPGDRQLERRRSVDRSHDRQAR